MAYITLAKCVIAFSVLPAARAASRVNARAPTCKKQTVVSSRGSGRVAPTHKDVSPRAPRTSRRVQETRIDTSLLADHSSSPARNSDCRRKVVCLFSSLFIIGMLGFMYVVTIKIPRTDKTAEPTNLSIWSKIYNKKICIIGGSLGIVFLFVTFCWRHDSDPEMENFDEGVFVTNKEGSEEPEGKIRELKEDRKTATVSWHGSNETSSSLLESLRLTAHERGADLIFKKKSDSSDDKLKSIVRGNLIGQFELVESQPFDPASFVIDGRHVETHSCNFKLDKTQTETGSSRVIVRFDGQGNPTVQCPEGGACAEPEQYVLDGVQCQTKNMGMLRFLFCVPGRILAEFRRGPLANLGRWFWSGLNQFRRCCCGGDEKEGATRDEESNVAEQHPTSICTRVCCVAGALLSCWDLILIALLFVCFSRFGAVSAWQRQAGPNPLETDPGNKVMAFFETYDKFILVGVGYLVLLWYFSGAINTVRAAEKIENLPRYGTFLIVVLGTVGKGIRFLTNLLFVQVTGGKEEGSDDFTAGWLFIELFLLATLYLFNYALAAFGLDFKPTNMNQAMGHVAGLSLDVGAKCLVALLCKWFYTSCLSNANAGDNPIASAVRRMQGWELSLILGATHVLLDLRQNRMAVNTAQYVRDIQEKWDAEGVKYQENSPYFKSYFRGEHKHSAPTFMASLFFVVDEAAELGVIIPALLHENETCCDCGPNAAAGNMKSVLMLLARGDKMRINHSRMMTQTGA